MRPFAKNLRKVRAYYELSQAQVAELIGIARATYQSYEEDRAQPSLELYSKMIKFYNVKDPIGFITNDSFNISDKTISRPEPSLFEKRFKKLKGKDKDAVMILLEIG